MDDLRSVKAGAVRLGCQVAGPPGAPPVLLLHALGEDGSTWAATVRALAESHRTYALDLRGHGAADRAAEYSFELMRDDVVAAMDALDLDRACLVGHSMGAAVAYLVAGDHPGRVERLVLEEPPPPVPLEPRALPDERDESAGFDWAAVAAIYAQRNDFDPSYWDRLRAVTAPTLIVAGGRASALPQEEIARMAETVRDCRLVTIEAGHLVHETRPAEFAAEVVAFLGGTAEHAS